MTCISSAEYYRLINQITREKLGGIHSAPSVMLSVDVAEIEVLMETGKWGRITETLAECSKRIEKAGAEFLVICTNTIHKLADDIQAQINIPILNIIDATAEQVKQKEINTVGLLGTRFTMEQDFYKGRLSQNHGLKVLTPSPEEVPTIHRVIVEELSIGKIKEESKKRYWKIIHRLVDQGAMGIILGCTEIPLLVRQEDGDIPLFDTTGIHAEAAVNAALS
jgi:aspartate racemase